MELFGKHLVRRSLTERRLGLGHNSLYLGRHGYLRTRELRCDMDWADGVVSTHPGPQDALQGQKNNFLPLYDYYYCVVLREPSVQGQLGFRNIT